MDQRHLESSIEVIESSSRSVSHTRFQQSWIALISISINQHQLHSIGVTSFSKSTKWIVLNVNDLHHLILHFGSLTSMLKHQHQFITRNSSSNSTQQQLNAAATQRSSNSTQQQLSPAATTTATANPNPKSSKHRRTSATAISLFLWIAKCFIALWTQARTPVFLREGGSRVTM